MNKQLLSARLVAIAALATAGGTALAAPYTLTTGAGDGSVTVGVDGYGSFGSELVNFSVTPAEEGASGFVTAVAAR